MQDVSALKPLQACRDPEAFKKAIAFKRYAKRLPCSAGQKILRTLSHLSAMRPSALGKNAGAAQT
jgi:hypothetical protein